MDLNDVIAEYQQKFDDLTPHVGVWIETVRPNASSSVGILTPHVGVWIETGARYIITKRITTHTSCRCVD